MKTGRTPFEAAKTLPAVGVGAALLGAVLLFAAPLNDSFALSKLLAVAAGAWLAWLGLSLEEEGALVRTPLDRALALFGAAALLSAAFSVDRPLSFLGRHYSYASGLLPWTLCAALFYAAAGIRSPELRARLLRWCVGAGGLSAAYALLQRLGLEPFALADYVPQSFVAGASGSPENLGACLLVLLPAGLHLSFSEDRRVCAPARVATLLMAGALALTLSFPAYAGGSCACLAFLVSSGRLPLKRPSRRGWQALAACALALLITLLIAGRAKPGMFSDPARAHTWLVACKAFAKRPVLGTGPDTLMLSFRRFRGEATLKALGDRRGYLSAQNDLVQALSTLGIVGLAAFLWLQWRLLLALRTSREENVPVAAGALAGLFVQAKLGAPPLAALAIVSVWTAWALPGQPFRHNADNYFRYSVLGLLSVLLFVVLRLCAADSNYALSIRAQLADRVLEAERRCGRAFELFPPEMQYGAGYNLFLLNRGQDSATPKELALELAAEAVRVGRDSVAWHPLDPASHHMLGLSLLIESRLGGPERLAEAAQALSKAQELDPYFLPLVETRLMVADQLHDADAAKAISQEHARISTLLERQ